MIIYQVIQLECRKANPIAYCATLDVAKDFVVANIPTDKIDVEQFVYNQGIRKRKNYFTTDNLDMLTSDNVEEFQIMENRNDGYHFHVYIIRPLEVIE